MSDAAKPAYVIFIRDGMKDPAEFALYGPKAAAARGDHKLTPLAFYGPLTVLEGPPAEGAVIIRFPSVAEARAWYDSPAYQEALRHRLKGADYRVMIIEGL